MVERFNRTTQLPARLTTGCVLDPCGLAYSLLRPPPVPPKVGPVRGWTTGLPAQAIATRQGRDWAAGPTIAAPQRLARDETESAGKAAKEGKGFRLGAQAGAAGRSLEYPLFVKHQKQPVSAKAAVRAWRIE